MKKLLFSASALTLTGLLLAGCGDESTDEKEDAKTEQAAEKDNSAEKETKDDTKDKEAEAETDKQDKEAEAEKKDEAEVDSTSIFAKDAKAVAEKTTAEKADYILKTYPDNLTKQSDYMEGIAKEKLETYSKDDYQNLLQGIMQDYLAGSYKDVDDRKSALIKIYSSRILADYSEDLSLKQVNKFADRYKTVVQDYYRGYDQKAESKPYVESDERLVKKAFNDLLEYADQQEQANKK